MHRKKHNNSQIKALATAKPLVRFDYECQIPTRQVDFMEAIKKQENDLFQQLGLAVTQGEVEIGQTYPIFGMITNVLSHNNSEVVLEINQNIQAYVQLSEPNKLDLLRQRAFETGIFVSKILSTEPIIKVDCRTIIFGRPQGHHV